MRHGVVGGSSPRPGWSCWKVGASRQMHPSGLAGRKLGDRHRAQQSRRESEERCEVLLDRRHWRTMVRVVCAAWSWRRGELGHRAWSWRRGELGHQFVYFCVEGVFLLHRTKSCVNVRNFVPIHVILCIASRAWYSWILDADNGCRTFRMS